MKLLLFSFVAFSILSFQSQAQGFIPGPNLQYNFDSFDWKSFNNKENIQQRIDFRNEMFRDIGADFIAPDISLGKTDLSRLEQELELYKQGIKQGLSPEEIQQAEEAIKLHRDNISNIEKNILDRGFNIIGTDRNITPTEQDYLSAVKKLYQGDHKIVFDMVEKTDQNLYSALGSSDSAYAKMILPQVEQYTQQMGAIAQNYYHSLASSNNPTEWHRDNIKVLIDMYSDSLTIYRCFLKNFQNSTDKHQQQLKQIIENWYGQQSQWGASALIETYRKQTQGKISPWFIVDRLNRFKSDTPSNIKAMIADFYKNDIINNIEFKNTTEYHKLGSRVEALIGLKYLGVLDEDEYQEELKLFEKALNSGIIESVGKNSFSGHVRPIK